MHTRRCSRGLGHFRLSMELYPQPSTQARKQHGPTPDATQPTPPPPARPSQGNCLQTQHRLVCLFWNFL